MRRFLSLMVGCLCVFGSFAAAAAASPDLTVTAPMEGVTLQEDNVTVTFQVTDFKLVRSSVPLDQAGKQPEANRPGEGHLHFMLDLRPLVVWERADPYTFENVAPGEHQLMVELVNNDHSPLSPPLVRHIRFQVAGARDLPETGAAASLPSGGRLVLGMVGVGCGIVGGVVLRRTRLAR